MKIDRFDEEEQAILDSYNRDEWQPVANVETAMLEYRAAAAYTPGQEPSIPIRISADDLAEIRRRAQTAGVPYSTLIAEIVHEFVTSHPLDDEDRQGHPSQLSRLKTFSSHTCKPIPSLAICS